MTCDVKMSGFQANRAWLDNKGFHVGFPGWEADIPFLNRRNGVFNRAEIILSVTIKKNDKDDEDDDKNLIISYRHIH